MKLPRLEEGFTAGTTRSVVSVAFPRYIYLNGWLLTWRLMERVGIENCFSLVLFVGRVSCSVAGVS